MPESRRLLLLTGTAPSPTGVGGIILHDLAGFLPSGMLSVVHLDDADGQGRDESTANGDPMRIVPVPFQRRPESRWGRPGRALDRLRMARANRRALAAGLRACVEYAQARRIDEVWAVLDTPVSIALAQPVADALGVPLRVTVWDDVEHNVGYFKLDRLTAQRCRASFAKAIHRACSVAVIGETMQAEYQRRYRQQGVILRHGAEQPTSSGPAAADREGLRIGFAGSVSARSAFDCLLAALDRLQWRVDGHEVTLVLMGQRFDVRSNVPRRIECLGYRSVEATVALLSECTINYLPQPFEAGWRPFAELSFPSKLTTYLAAGAPILLHAPAYASLPKFFEQHPFGALATELDAAALADALETLCIDRQRRAAARHAGSTALAEAFSVERFRADFARFLDLPLPATRQAAAT